jgi:hypothetical protein
MTREELVCAVNIAKSELCNAIDNLSVFDSKAENNIFLTIEDAINEIESKLEHMAYEDCEGAGNCGSELYTQEFIVDGKKYLATMTFEYNRHDKTYYYIEESNFTYEEII